MKQEIKSRIEQINRGEVPDGYKKTKVGIVPNEWEETHLKSYFTRLTRKNKEKNTNVLTISAQYGLINQNDFFNKEVASEDKSNYYLLEKGDFAYNKSYSNGYPFGAIKKLTYYDKGVVSPLYICFSASEKNKFPNYFEQYFEAGKLNREIQAFAQEGARNHGLLNISVDDFFNSYINVPPLTEQQRIAEILTTQDKLIELKEKLIAEKKQQKKYLMQNLLTGKKRLKGFNSEWKKVKLGEITTYKSSTISASSLEDFVCDELYPLYDANKILKYIDTYQNESKYISIIKDGAGIGRLFLCEEKSSVIGTMGMIINNSQSQIIWLYYICLNIDFNKYSNGSTIPHVYYKDYSLENIYLPPLEEQNAIAEILSTADNEIQLLEKQLTEEKQKKKALMQLLLKGIVRA